MRFSALIFAVCIVAGCAAKPVPPRVPPEQFKCGIPEYSIAEGGYVVKHGPRCK